MIGAAPKTSGMLPRMSGTRPKSPGTLSKNTLNEPKRAKSASWNDANDPLNFESETLPFEALPRFSPIGDAVSRKSCAIAY